MKLKKLIMLITCLALLLSLAACSGDNGDQPDGSPDEGENTNDPAEDNNDAPGDDGDGDDAAASYSDGFDDRGFFTGVKAGDIVKLPEYKGLDPVTEPKAETVESLRNSLLANYTEYEHLTEGTIADGDTVNIDYVGSIDGVEFQGGSTQGNGTTVTIGVTSYIDDFLEQLIGHAPGENFDIEVTFPDPYESNPDLAGKDAVFNVTINYIQGDAIERDIDEEIAKDQGFDTVEECLEYIDKVALRQDVTTAASALLGGATCEEIPESVIETIKNLTYLNIQASASRYGMTAETLLQMSGFTSIEDYFQRYEEDIRSQAVLYLAAQAIAEAEGLEVTAQDIARTGSESAVAACGEPYVHFQLLNVLILPEFLYSVTLAELETVTE